MKSSLFRKPFVILLTVPAAIVLAIGATPLLLVALERHFAPEASYVLLPAFDAASARSFLVTVAGGAMTALSLAYSLTLVVFTLAAGTIGPRLLKRFTTDPVAQVTAGILGGTFLYAIATLPFVRTDQIPLFATTGAGLLSIISVLQLIYFVRNVSRAVTIDDEVANITSTAHRIIRHMESQERLDEEKTDGLPKFGYELKAQRSGYVGEINTDRIVAIANEAGCMVRLSKRTGKYVLEGESLAGLDCDCDEETRDAILGSIEIASARSDNGTLDFPVSLLVEIALRALSPGINDTFTALAVVDSLSSIMHEYAQLTHADLALRDKDGAIRLVQPGYDTSELVGMAFHPMRRAASSNILMAQGLARALARLSLNSYPPMVEAVRKHTALLLRQVDESGHFEDDIQSVREILPLSILSENRA